MHMTTVVSRVGCMLLSGNRVARFGVSLRLNNLMDGRGEGYTVGCKFLKRRKRPYKDIASFTYDMNSLNYVL